MDSRYGITIPFDGVTLNEHREWFTRLADLGYSDVWSSEVDGADGFLPLAIAANESRLNLGLAVAPAFTRGPGLLAMSVAALGELAGGRFTMGLGSSSQPVVERWNGIHYDKPYSRVRDTLRFLKKALNGEKIDEVFDTFEIHGFKLSRPVIDPPAILLGALRPKMLQLAGAEADGVILNWLGAEDVIKCRDEVGVGKTIAARLFVMPTTDTDSARFVARRMISSYLSVSAYADFHRWLGREEILTPFWEAWNAGDRKRANEVIPDVVVDDLIIHGSYESCREQLARYVEAGVEVPIVAVVPYGIDLKEAVEGLAPR